MEITPATSSVNSSSPTAATYDDNDDDEEEDVCRICRNRGEEDNPLRYPCACSGSIKFVHQNCLLQWLNHSNSRHCEVCKRAFAFCLVYAEDAPSRLPFWEFVLGVGKKAGHVCHVLLLWLFIIPFITFWICRLAFVRSFSEANRIFLSHMPFTVILIDCLHGFLISAYIVGVLLAVKFLRYCFRRLRELERLLVEIVDEGDRNGGRVVRRHVEQGNRNLAAVGDVDDVGGAQEIPVAGLLIQRNVENVAAQFWRQAARLEARVEQMFDRLGDADHAEDVPFNELVGMQGPLFHFPDASTVLASTMIFVGAVIFVPFSLGRLILHYVTWLVTSATNPVLSTVMLLTESALSLANITLRNVLMAVTNLTFNNPENNLFDQVNEMTSLNASAVNISSNISTPLASDILKGMTSGTSRFSDLTTLAVGHMFIVSLFFLCFGIFGFIKYTRREPLVNGRSQGIASIFDAVPLSRQLFACMRHLMTVIKVSFLLVIELWIFPLMCGWWLDVCTIRMFGKSLAQRVEFFSDSPLASSLLHWVVGIFYMLQISIFLSLLRGVLRTGVLYFIRDPADPNYHPFRDQIDDPLNKHACRLFLAVAVYGCLIVMLVFLPVKLAMGMVPSIFPLDISVSDPFTEIPAGILLLQICIPFAIEHFKVRTIKSRLLFWFTAVVRVLGLTDYLLPQPEDTVVQDNGNAEAGRQVRLRDQQLGGVVLDDLGQLPLRPDAPINESLDSANSGMSDVEEQLNSERYGFIFRIILLVVVAWMTLLVINSALVVIPVSLGRLIFNAIPYLPITHGIKFNDLYAFTIGGYLIWMAIAGVRYTIDQIKSRRAADLLGQICKWCPIALRSSALLSIWIFVIPVLIGLLFELLVTVPLQVPVDESPVFLLYQNWTFGLIFLKIWTKLVMLDIMIPLVDESWRTKFQRVRENGFSRLQGMWVLQEIELPIILRLLTVLCVPYVLARGVFPVFGYPLMVNSAVYRFSWLGCLCFSVLLFCAKRFHVLLTNLHNSILDDHYLIGRRLRNIEELTENMVEGESQTLNLQRDIVIGQEVDMGLRHQRRNVVNMELLIQIATVTESYLRLWPFPG